MLRSGVITSRKTKTKSVIALNPMVQRVRKFVLYAVVTPVSKRLKGSYVYGLEDGIKMGVSHWCYGEGEGNTCTDWFKDCI